MGLTKLKILFLVKKANCKLSHLQLSQLQKL